MASTSRGKGGSASVRSAARAPTTRPSTRTGHTVAERIVGGRWAEVRSSLSVVVTVLPSARARWMAGMVTVTPRRTERAPMPV